MGVVLTSPIVANCVGIALLCHYDCHEAACCNIHNLISIFDWEDLCAIHKVSGNFIVFYFRINVVI